MLKFNEGQFVIVPEVGREGVVIGVAQYRNHETDYQLRWTGGRGEKCENWFGESAVEKAQPKAALAPATGVARKKARVRGGRAKLKASKAAR